MGCLIRLFTFGLICFLLIFNSVIVGDTFFNPYYGRGLVALILLGVILFSVCFITTRLDIHGSDDVNDQTFLNWIIGIGLIILVPLSLISLIIMFCLGISLDETKSRIKEGINIKVPPLTQQEGNQKTRKLISDSDIK